MVKLIALLALFAATASTLEATSVPTTGTNSNKPFLKFDKPVLNIQGNVVGETVSVSLTEKPTDDVVVYIEAPSTRFDKCSLAFSPDNFDKPQALTVVSVPFTDAAPGARAIPIKFTAFTEDCESKHHNVSVELPTTRTKEGSGQCQVTGDPHYKQFDATALYHYQGVGDYYLVKSSNLVVQARQGKCFGKASCVHALAVRYGTASFVVDSNDINPDTCVKTITNLDGIVISKTRSGVVTTVNVAFNAGSSMKIDIYGSGDARYMNVFVDVANHLKGKVNGLCGRFDGNPANDFSSPDGQTTYPAQEIIAQSAADMFGQSPNFPKTPLFFYGESWRVPETENLFACRDKCPGLDGMTAPLPAPVAECRIPTVVPKCEPKPKPEPEQPQDPIQQKPIQTLSSSMSTSTALSTATATTPAAGSSTASTTLTAGGAQTTPATSSTASTTSTAQTQGQVTTSSSSSTATGTGTGTGTASATTTKAADQQQQTSTTSTGSSTASSAASNTSTATTSTVKSSTTTNAQPQPTQEQPQQPQPGKPTNPGNKQPHKPIVHIKPRKPICPRPIIVIPIPSGYRRQVQLPRYKQQPRPPVYRPLPQPPQKMIDDAKRGCARKIVRIDQCTVDLSRFIQACEADVAAQVNPEIVFDMHNDAYTDLCAKQIIDKVREPFPDVAKRAREALKKHCFGNTACDNQCLQCSPRGCLECKDRSKFEVQGGRCVTRKTPPMQYEQQYFSQRPKYRALADSDIVAVGASSSKGDAADEVDPTFNADAVVETTSVSVAVAEDPVKAEAAAEEIKAKVAAEGEVGGAAGQSSEEQSSAARLALSSVAGVVALVASLML